MSLEVLAHNSLAAVLHSTHMCCREHTGWCRA